MHLSIYMCREILITHFSSLQEISNITSVSRRIRNTASICNTRQSLLVSMNVQLRNPAPLHCSSSWGSTLAKLKGATTSPTQVKTTYCILAILNWYQNYVILPSILGLGGKDVSKSVCIESFRAVMGKLVLKSNHDNLLQLIAILTWL